jgi:polyisoprenoid-binding protein YceI
MTQESSAQPSRPADARVGAWSLDPARSSVEFHVRHFYGLVTVKGSFKSYTGTLDLNAEPAVQLTIKAASLDTNKANATSTCAQPTSLTSTTTHRSGSSPIAPRSTARRSR